MKKNLYILLLLTTWFSNAQVVSIPDANFKAALIALGIDTNADSEIQESEALQITSIDVNNTGIIDLTGIEAFINLEYLSCDLNGITSLDLSQNVNLVELHCWHNLLENLDFSQNTNLRLLHCNGNQLTNLNVTQNLNLEELYCYSNDLTTIDISQNANLNYLNCSGNRLTTVDASQNSNLRTLNCYGNDITDIDVSLNSNLETFDCSGNSLNGIDVSQNISLTTLKCISSELTTIDVSQNVNLERLECNNNQLTNLDVSQNANLEILICNYNQLNSLDLTQNESLVNLDIWHNQFLSIDITQNLNLEVLSCGQNQLSDLDVTQNPNLKTLSCYLNQLTYLDVSQNIDIESIYCSYNQLTTIDLMQNASLESLNCRNNQVNALNLSQCIGLTQLNCTNNQITNLDLSENPVFESLFGANNQLTELNIKNGSIEGFVNFSGNPDLAYICVDDQQFEAINALADDTVEVNSYCSFTSGGDFNAITGTAFFDVDNNGCDTNDIGQFNVRIDINDGTNQGATFTNGLGNYTFYTEIGSFDLSPSIENSPWFNITPALTTIQFTDDNNNSSTQDYCLTTNGIHNDVEVLVLPLIPARPGFDAIYQIVYRNKGNQILSGTIDFIYDDTVLNFIFSSDTPSNQTTGNLSWNYSNLLPFESRSVEVTLNVNSPMETPAVNIDDILNFTATISPVTVDEIPSDNTFDLNQVVVGSYDPNDITCLEGDLVNPEQIGEFLHYNINFENTGTAAATFIVVRDEIDETRYDINSLQVLYSSHNVVTRITNHLIEFIFDDINLAAEGKGNVLFKIKTKADLVLGDSVSNKADIYFDYNFPIETNTATTVFDVLSVEEFEANTFKVFPNPVKDIINVSSAIEIKSIAIYDIHGRLVLKQLTHTNMFTIDSSQFVQGVYVLNIVSKNGVEENIKLIKN